MGSPPVYEGSQGSRRTIALPTFRLLVASASPVATFDFSAPWVWKGILRLAVSGEFIRYKIDFRGLAERTTCHSAQRLLAAREQLLQTYFVGNVVLERILVSSVSLKAAIELNLIPWRFLLSEEGFRN
jgi:hypothetical protein